MTLRWTPPDQPNGILLGYLLQYQQSKKPFETQDTQGLARIIRPSFFDISGKINTRERMSKAPPNNDRHQSPDA